jgi:hypothetical protein
MRTPNTDYYAYSIRILRGEVCFMHFSNRFVADLRACVGMSVINELNAVRSREQIDDGNNSNTRCMV